jgi:3-methylcrotonyl-CoA carboxylase alpha subunit
MFSKILIANRGEIACRVMRTARRLGIACVAVYSDADRNARHVAEADEAYRIGPAPVADSYLRIDAIIDAARRAGAEAIHPGYGFLSENPAFVEACDAARITFIGPPASAIRAMGLKDAAKRLMEQAGVPIVPGYHGDRQEPQFLASEAARIGYPVLIKARAGGGGKGMRRVDEPSAFPGALDSARREAASSFGDDRVLVEKYVAKPRHIEVQVFADGHGNAVHLFERDCSLQRRHQKVIEEAPAPGMTTAMRAAMGKAAVDAALSVGYRGAGTVEFIVDASAGLRSDRFYFMEMNTRLQVEHPVTEAITGHDLVEWQLRVAAGAPLPVNQADLTITGHAFEARLYAEDAEKGFLPATGTLTHLHLPADLARIDTGVREGDTITPFYDPMIAKLIVHGPDRATALARLSRALAASRILGCTTNLAFLLALSRHVDFTAGDVDTGLIDRDRVALTAVAPPDGIAKVIAALAALGLTKRPADADPWSTLAGWRQWDQARQYPLLAWRGDRLNIGVTALAPGRYEMAIGPDRMGVAIEGRGSGALRFTIDGRNVEATIIERGEELAVFIDGRANVFTMPDRLADLDDDASGEDRIIAPMPGLVKIVRARPGAKVLRGEPLVVLEAMKMEHTLTAPRDGSIDEVLAKPGEQVSDGVVLVRLAPATA